MAGLFEHYVSRWAPCKDSFDDQSYMDCQLLKEDSIQRSQLNCQSVMRSRIQELMSSPDQGPIPEADSDLASQQTCHFVKHVGLLLCDKSL
jgi:hypothetical protein